MKKFAALLVLGYLYKALKKPYTEHPFYKAGIIDKNGNLIADVKKLTPEQKQVYTILNNFSYKLKKTLDKNPTLKAGVITTLLGSIFLKESNDGTESSPFVYYNNEPAIKIKANKYNEEAGLVELVTESGLVVTGKDNIQEIDLLSEEIANTTAIMPNIESPINHHTHIHPVIKRKLDLRKAYKKAFLKVKARKEEYKSGDIFDTTSVAPKEFLNK